MFRSSSNTSKNTEYAAANALCTAIFTCFVMAVSSGFVVKPASVANSHSYSINWLSIHCQRELL